MSERASMPVDVAIVGGGPSGLAAAIRLKQLADENNLELSIVVLEKASEIGGHILSGAVIDSAALNRLIPNWKEHGAPFETAVTSESFVVLSKMHAMAIPNVLLPPVLSNHGNYIVSLGQLCKWLAAQAEAMGIDVFPGFAASEILYDKAGNVKGVATGDMGVTREGAQGPGFTPGMELHARYTLIAEGARGSLAKDLIKTFRLDANSDPQHYGIGIKEIWEIQPSRHRLGHVEHHIGWPLDGGTGGGGFVYHASDNQVFAGYVVHLNYTNPHLSPFDEMQRWKTHPRMRALLEGGRRISFGARAMTSGGWQSIPELAFPGGALIGCSAGFMNVPRIKGIHNAMFSGIKTAEAVFEALQQGRGNDRIENLNLRVTKGEIGNDLQPVRNAKPMLTKYGALWGTLAIGFDQWASWFLKTSLFGTMPSRTPDHSSLRPGADCAKPDYPRPDGKLTFDRTSSVYLANLAHDENQPVHLRLGDPEIPIRENLPLYDEPAQRYCPAGVYEIMATEGQKPYLRINAANCVHCKTCDIKDPAQNITWVPPEGGSGPNYQGM